MPYREPLFRTSDTWTEALDNGTQMLLGVVDCPTTGELYYAAKRLQHYCISAIVLLESFQQCPAMENRLSVMRTYGELAKKFESHPVARTVDDVSTIYDNFATWFENFHDTSLSDAIEAASETLDEILVRLPFPDDYGAATYDSNTGKWSELHWCSVYYLRCYEIIFDAGELLTSLWQSDRHRHRAFIRVEETLTRLRDVEIRLENLSFFEDRTDDPATGSELSLQLITRREICERWEISKSTITNRIQSAEFPRIWKVSGTRELFSVPEVESFMLREGYKRRT